MIPNYPDCDHAAGEKLFTAKEISDFMSSFYKHQIFDVKHELVKNGSAGNVATLIESYQLKEPRDHLPAGTWIVSAKITDDDVWNQIKEGKLTGFSVTALPGSLAGKISAKSMNPFKRDRLRFELSTLALKVRCSNQMS